MRPGNYSTSNEIFLHTFCRSGEHKAADLSLQCINYKARIYLDLKKYLS